MRRAWLAAYLIFAIVGLAFAGFALWRTLQIAPGNVNSTPAPAPTAALSPTPSQQPIPSPSASPAPAAALRFVNFGDWGNSKNIDPAVFRQLERTHASLGFSDIVTNGDNNYAIAETFPVYVERELGALIRAGVELHFSLGNHDIDDDAKWQQQVGNLAWGEWDCSECSRARPASAASRYYSFYRAPVRFVMLESNLMLDGDTDQFGWAAQEISASVAANEPWQVLAFHHPPFSAAATHGGLQQLVDRLKPVLRALGVDVVFTGHDHTYERIKTTPACGDGVQYVVSGAIYVRKGDIKTPNDCTAAYWDQSQAFVYVTATPSEFSAQTITSEGKVVDEWEIRKQ